jgi:tetratricopeptide (TPR) repeat protein
MGLFYLLTLYAFIRGRQSARPGPWPAVSVAACLLGMGTKEVMVSAPLMVLLYDRTFVSGTFQAAWRQGRAYYSILAATWIPLGLLVAGNGGNRGGSIGFGTGVSWWHHALSQFEAVARYLQLSVWPHPLVFEYGPFWRQSPQDIVPCATLVTALAAATVFALWRRPAGGFFAILAPTCLMPGSTQIFVEHRMYLALAAVVALAVTAIHGLGGRRSLAVLVMLAGALGVLTHRRNLDYRSELALWQDTVAKRPFNSMAHSSLGSALVEAGRQPEAIAEFEAALRLWPDNIEAHTNLGEALSAAGRPAEALDHLQAALQLRPDYPEAQLNLGTALDRIGRTAEAIPHYEAALRAKPELADAHNNLGNALLRSGRAAEAVGQIQEALRLNPGHPAAHYNLANALVQAGRLPEALAQYEIAIREQPHDPVLFYDYGNALGAAKRFEDAARSFTEALRLRPDYPEACDNLGNALVMLGRVPEAVAQYEQALRLKPDNPGAHNNLGLALARLGRMREAQAQFAAAVQLAPDFQAARENLAHAQAELAGAAPKT